MNTELENLLQNLPSADTGEVFTTLLSDKNLRIERIVSNGQKSEEGDYYDQPQAEWILVLQGSAQLELEVDGAMKTIALSVGSCINIPAHCLHRVLETSLTEQTVWLAIHYGELNL